MLITKELLKRAGVKEALVDRYLPYLQELSVFYKVNTAERVTAFLSNVLLECMYFTQMEESFNYSRKRLLEVFPKYFNSTNVDKYVGKPRDIANVVYANRMGNGGVSSGDGWRYRGKGAKQITGKENQLRFGKYVGRDFSINSDPISQEPRLAVLSAFWFWDQNSLNTWADKVKIAKTEAEKTLAYKNVASIINTGKPGKTPNGWADREIIRKRIEKYV